MRLRIDDAVKSVYPNLKVAIVEAQFSGKVELNQELLTTKKEIEDRIKSDYSAPETLDRVVKYNVFYKRFGSKVPMEFQIKSVLNGKEVPLINPVLTCMFLAELKNIVLTAGHDVTTLGKEINVRLSDGSQSYTKINEKEQVLKPQDIFAFDGKGIISSVLSGPDSRTKITGNTRDCLFMCYAFDMSDEELECHLNDILGLLRFLTPGLETGKITVL